MKVLLIGAGTLGRAIKQALLQDGHEVIVAALADADIDVDAQNSASIKAMYETAHEKIGPLDAVIPAAGEQPWKKIPNLTEDDVTAVCNGIAGYVNLVRYGLDYMNDNGVFITTSGDVDTCPTPMQVMPAAMIGFLEIYVRGASLSLPRGIRINAIRVPMLAESAPLLGITEGDWVTADECAQWYMEALNNDLTGQTRGEEGWSDFVPGREKWNADALLESLEH